MIIPSKMKKGKKICFNIFLCLIGQIIQIFLIGIIELYFKRKQNFMSRISPEEAKSAISAQSWNEQRQFIEHIEELLMDEDEVITIEEIQICFNVLSKYLSDKNKDCVQRSMKIIEALCNSMKENGISTNVSTIFKSVFQCLNDSRPNIREQSTKTINSLCTISTFSLFTKNTSELALSFLPEGKLNVLQILQNHQDELTYEEWNHILVFVIQSYEDKSQAIKSRAQDLTKCETFIQVLRRNFDKLNPSQKKLFQGMIDKLSKPAEDSKIDHQEVQLPRNVDPKLPVIDLNTSAFSRRQRQGEFKESDGLFLITDVSTFIPFMHRLSLDVRDVFDDEVSEKLLSQQSLVRVIAVDHLRDIFDSSIKNFENSIDIVLRWCVIQFLGYQLNVSQASLRLLTDLFDRCSDKFILTSKEVHIIVPVILWCTATESEAFSYLLQQIRRLSKEKDFNQSLLMSLSLDHSAVITHIFDELKKSTQLDTIEGQLKELCVEGCYMVRNGCQKLLKKLAPMSPRRAQSGKDNVSRLQYYIQLIKSNPDDVDDSHAVFGFLLDYIERKPTDPREIRYLLYCMHAFLSEPYLVDGINQNDFATLVSALCEFSLDCPLDFSDALLSIGFVIVSIHANITIFEALINFIGQHINDQTRRSFAFQTFTIGIQLIAVSQDSSDLLQLRTFAKSVIAQNSSKDDLRAILCRSLLAEIFSLENQQKNDLDLFKSFDDFSALRQQSSTNVLSEVDVNGQSASVLVSSDDLSDFLKILQRINRQDSRTEGIRELINFDERFTGMKIIDTISSLSPLLRKDIENMRNRGTNSRPSSRNSYRGEESNDLNRSFGNKYSRPTSRSSSRQPSVGHDTNARSKTQSGRPSSRSSNNRNFNKNNW
ncbi:hypothetical protein TRFO_18107 [Tritrichomonas foetus]|uniref:TOG domain-containing protein n=1 Tax=Tritrichomonas foetus TaxID=1144522 RepID=A0A1J4KLM5_9EUKA|nr:hypothetical protein TRFO_18107 [Tritrichomonas foetus]|eukprot:OHT12201.1 hypothetical protein TRFO_18107 [Tritrichomonas foetus]